MNEEGGVKQKTPGFCLTLTMLMKQGPSSY